MQVCWLSTVWISDLDLQTGLSVVSNFQRETCGLMVLKNVFLMYLLFPEFFNSSKKYSASCCFSQETCFPVNRMLIECDAHLFSLFYLLIYPFFPLSFQTNSMSYSSQLTSCSPYWLSHVLCKHTRPSFKGNDLCLKWMNEKPYICCFQLSCLFIAVPCCVISAWHVHVVLTTQTKIIMITLFCCYQNI